MGRKATSEYNLAVIHPIVAKEWHPTKNKPLTPKDVTPGSHKKVWWKCKHQHTWEAVVKSRSRGRSCPECSGRKAGKDNNLAVIHPIVAKEWHPTKNKPLTPKDVTPGSGKKVWWKCKKDHEWEALVSSRSGGRSCPECAKLKRVINKKKNRIKSGNTLKKIYPDLIKEWDFTKNKIKPEEVAPVTNTSVWWICRRGHNFKARIANRTIHRSSCPICKNQSSKLEIKLLSFFKVAFKSVVWRKKLEGVEADIFIQNKKIAVELDGYPWHKNRKKQDEQKSKFFKSKGIRLIRIRDDRNPKIKGSIINYKNNEKKSFENAVFQCVSKINNQKEFMLTSSQIKKQKAIYDKLLSKYPGPPFEKSLLAKLTGIKEYWSEKNKINPEDVWSGSNEEFRIICQNCGNNFIRSPKLLLKTKFINCIDCSYKLTGAKRRDRAVEYSISLREHSPILIKEWSSKNKLPPGKFAFGSNQKVWWTCPMGHEYETRIQYRTIKNSGCPFCAGKKVCRENSLTHNFPKLVKEWNLKLNKKTPDQITRGSGYLASWICSKCRYKWQTKVLNRTINNSGCPVCSGSKVGKTNNFLTMFPKTAKEWHPTKNGNLKPQDVTYGSNKKVWWQCKQKHTWEAVVKSRGNLGRGCPYCYREKK